MILDAIICFQCDKYLGILVSSLSFGNTLRSNSNYVTFNPGYAKNFKNKTGSRYLF